MRSKFINRYAKEIVKKLHGSLTADFTKNKQLIAKIETGMTKRQVNELAGYVTKLAMKLGAE